MWQDESAPVTVNTLMAGMERFTCTVIATVSKYIFLFLLKAPSDGPLLLGTAETTSTSIVVVWGTVQCIDHNSNITGYMCYTLNSITNDVMVSGTGESGGMLTLDELAPSTQYTIQVAAVSTDGAVGQFSAIRVQTITESKFLHKY